MVSEVMMPLMSTTATLARVRPAAGCSSYWRSSSSNRNDKSTVAQPLMKRGNRRSMARTARYGVKSHRATVVTNGPGGLRGAPFSGGGVEGTRGVEGCFGLLDAGGVQGHLVVPVTEGLPGGLERCLGNE